MKMNAVEDFLMFCGNLRSDAFADDGDNEPNPIEISTEDKHIEGERP